MSNIDNERQNHPELVVKDLLPFVGADVVRAALKRRGINKWLRVRRLLIALKSRWKDELGEARSRAALPTEKRREYWRGYAVALDNCRQQVRALCHSPRDVDWPETAAWPECASLPTEFPAHPHKRWFWRWDKAFTFEEER